MQKLQKLSSAKRNTLLDSFKKDRSTVELRSSLGWITAPVCVVRSNRNGRYRVIRTTGEAFATFHYLRRILLHGSLA